MNKWERRRKSRNEVNKDQRKSYTVKCIESRCFWEKKKFFTNPYLSYIKAAVFVI